MIPVRPKRGCRKGWFATVREDLRTVMDRDPAATHSILTVFFCYPGLHAVWAHRFTHWLWRLGLHFPARFVSQIVRWFTGIEIHPAASIGCRLFIDHGMGIVIGETAIVGNDVTLFQGVTLGGTGKQTGKRHPTLLDGVFVGNNANILGNITIGENSRVGAGSVVLQDVPPNSTVVGVPAHIIYREGQRVLITDPHEIKDPLSDSLIALSNRVEELEQRLQGLDGKLRSARDLDCFEPLSAESRDRREYTSELARRRDYVMDGEGI